MEQKRTGEAAIRAAGGKGHAGSGDPAMAMGCARAPGAVQPDPRRMM